VGVGVGVGVGSTGRDAGSRSPWLCSSTLSSLREWRRSLKSRSDEHAKITWRVRHGPPACEQFVRT
jgi:hypothetical protein